MSASNYQKCISALTSIQNKYPQLLNEFIEWHKQEGWDDEGLNDEFSEDITDSSFIDYLKENNKITPGQQELEIFSLLHNAITSDSIQLIQAPIQSHHTISDSYDENEYKQPLNPSISVVVKILSTDITPKEKKKQIESKHSATKKRLKKQLPIMLPKEKKVNAHDILYIEYIGHKNDNYPLLLHLVDTYVRYQLNKWIQNDKNPSIRNKITIQNFFDNYCNHPHFRQYSKHKNSQQIIHLAKTAIKSYQTRLLLPFQCMQPVYKISDKNPLLLFNYIFEMAHIVRNIADTNISTQLPTQIDFMIINKDIIFSAPDPKLCQGIKQLFEQNSDDDDSDDAEYEQVYIQQDEPKENDKDKTITDDISALFKSKKIKYFTYDKPNRWMECIEDIKKLTDNQRAKRNIFVLDRRQKVSKNDKLYLYKPAKFNKFEKNEQQLIHASLHYNSAKSMFPREHCKKNEDDFDVRCSLRGQMFVMSYHILSKEEIRCYLFYQGQSFRFFGEDLINVLPSFFIDDKNVEQMLLNKINTQYEFRKQFDEFCSTFTDNKFELFYHGLTNKNAQMGNIIPNDKWYHIVNKYRNGKRNINNSVSVNVAPVKVSKNNNESVSNNNRSHSISDDINIKPTISVLQDDNNNQSEKPAMNMNTDTNTDTPTTAVEEHVDISKTVRNKCLQLLKDKVNGIDTDDSNEGVIMPDGLITTYTGNNGNTGNQNNNYNTSDNSNNDNGYNGSNNNGNNSGGSGGYGGGYGCSAGGDGDDEKGNEKDHKSEDEKTTDDDESEDNSEEEEKKEEEKEDDNNNNEERNIDRLFDILNNMKDINDSELPNMLSPFSPTVFSKLRQGMNELNKEMQRVSYAWNALNVPKKKKSKKKYKKKYKKKMKRNSLIMKHSVTNETPEPSPATTPLPPNNKNNSHNHKKCVSNLINYAPSSIKSKYFIPRNFTETIIPLRIREKINVEKKAVFDFIIKSLAINNKNNIRIGDKLIFNFDLHDKNTNENLYIICKYQNPSNPKNRGSEWLIINLCNKKEILNNYNIAINRLPKSQTQTDIFKQINIIKYKIENILNNNSSSKISIIQKTKWNKIQIYNRINNKRRLTLSLSNPEFIACCKSSININNNNLNLIPIIMFDRYEKYSYEYIWIINIEKSMNIGISLKYDIEKNAINVNGIHLDKTFIYKQHIVIEPSHECNCLNNFTSFITHLHIGNPDDNINKIKDLQNRLQTLKDENVSLNEKLFSNNNRSYSFTKKEENSIHSNTLPLHSHTSSNELALANNYSTDNDDLSITAN